MTNSQIHRQSLDKRTRMWHDESLDNNLGPATARRLLMPRPFGSRIVLNPDTRQQLQTLVRAGSTPQALAFRCRLILQAAAEDRPTNQAIAAALDCDRHTVGQWRERFAAHGF